jgi:hypothetical protein
MNKISVLCSIALLAACGHNSGSSGTSQQQAEDSAASASIPALVAFSEAQIARADADVSEPRDLAGITPPASDVDEPAAI